MFSRWLRWSILALGALSLTGCRVQTDLGKECVLVRQDPSDPQKSIAIKEGEITPGKDIISLSVVECEDFVCVRDGSAGRKAGTTDDDPAVGYCSRQCVRGSSIGCQSADPADDKNPERALSCRALLLDEGTLQAIRIADPAGYRRAFGETTSPYFCARGTPEGT